MLRIRFTYQKAGEIIYTSNLDLQKIWERSCRRAKLRIAYTLGFHPQARIQQAAPLPLGFSSKSEIVDIWLDEDSVPSDLVNRINLVLPNGLKVITSEPIDLKESALQNRIISCIYNVKLFPGMSRESLEQKIGYILKADKLIYLKRGKTINLRERIESIELIENGLNEPFDLIMHLTQRPGLTGRPDDILIAMDINPFLTQIERINIIYS